MANHLNLKDIQNRILSDFGDKSTEVNSIFNEAITKTEYLNHPRIIRSILFLANGNIESLNRTIDVAIFDPRDVMVQAEYEGWENMFKKTPKRMRDFNQPF